MRHPFRTAFVVPLFLGIVVGTVGLGNPLAGAATGDTVSTIIAVRASDDACKSTNVDGDHGGVATGIAFDGTNLILSCWGSGLLSFVSPTDGSFVKELTTTAGDLGALAFDATNSQLWVCENGSDVGTVDLGTGVYTKAFTSDGCVDGLAYDGVTDTIWASDDASTPVTNYKKDGTVIDSFPVSLAGQGNSGLAVGKDVIYMGNNGGSAIFTAPRTDLSSATEFISPAKTGDRRVEDLECDNITFAAQNKTVLWSQDAYDNILNAYEVPLDTCAFGGSAPTTTSTTSTTSTTAPSTTAAPAAAAATATPRFTG